MVTEVVMTVRIHVYGGEKVKDQDVDAMIL